MLEEGWAKLPQGNLWKLLDPSPIPDDCRKSAGLEAKGFQIRVGCHKLKFAAWTVRSLEFYTLCVKICFYRKRNRNRGSQRGRVLPVFPEDFNQWKQWEMLLEKWRSEE